MAYCPNCGKQIGETANFCRACGYNLKDAQAEQPQPEAKGQPSKCAIHATRDSVGLCSVCGKTVCDLCRTAAKGKLFCPSCIFKVSSDSSAKVNIPMREDKSELKNHVEDRISDKLRVSEDIEEPVGGQPIISVGKDEGLKATKANVEPYKEKGNWFRRHPSSTIGITSLLSYILSIVFAGAIVILIEWLTPRWLLFISIVYLVLYTCCFIVCGWALRQKQRSLLWILLLIIPWILSYIAYPIHSVTLAKFTAIVLFFGWGILVYLREPILTKEQKKAGLYLEKEKGFVNLMRDGEFLTSFPVKGTTNKALREKAQEYV